MNLSDLIYSFPEQDRPQLLESIELIEYGYTSLHSLKVSELMEILAESYKMVSILQRGSQDRAI